MKLSVSLSEEDIAFLDAYAESHGIGSRSAVLHKAVRVLRASELGAAYEDAWHDWEVTDAEVWEQTVADRLGGR